MTHEGGTLPSIDLSEDEAGNVLQADHRWARLPARALRPIRQAILLIASHPARRNEPRAAATSLAGLNDEIAAEFNLGAKTGGLAEQVMRLIAGQPGGLAAFGEKFETSGRGAEAASWHGGACAPLTVRQVKKLVGAPFIKEVANYLEIPQGFASKILGVIIPRILDLQAAPDVRLDEIAAGARVFSALALGRLRRRAEDQIVASKEQIPLLRTDVRDAARLHFVVSIAALVVTAGLLGAGYLAYGMSSGAANSAAAGIKNGANAAALTCPLASGFGTRKMTGDFAVGAGWTKNLTAEFDSFGSVGSKTFVAGNVLSTKGALPHPAIAGRKAYASALQPASTSRKSHIHRVTWKRHQPGHRHAGFYVIKQHSS